MSVSFETAGSSRFHDNTQPLVTATTLVAEVVADQQPDDDEHDHGHVEVPRGWRSKPFAWSIDQARPDLIAAAEKGEVRGPTVLAKNPEAV